MFFVSMKRQHNFALEAIIMTIHRMNEWIFTQNYKRSYFLYGNVCPNCFLTTSTYCLTNCNSNSIIFLFTYKDLVNLSFDPNKFIAQLFSRGNPLFLGSEPEGSEWGRICPISINTPIIFSNSFLRNYFVELLA